MTPVFTAARWPACWAITVRHRPPIVGGSAIGIQFLLRNRSDGALRTLRYYAGDQAPFGGGPQYPVGPVPSEWRTERVNLKHDVRFSSPSAADDGHADERGDWELVGLGLSPADGVGSFGLYNGIAA